MPGGQPKYVQLPDGKYVEIPADATPEQLDALRDRLSSMNLKNPGGEAAYARAHTPTGVKLPEVRPSYSAMALENSPSGADPHNPGNANLNAIPAAARQSTEDTLLPIAASTIPAPELMTVSGLRRAAPAIAGSGALGYGGRKLGGAFGHPDLGEFAGAALGAGLGEGAFRMLGPEDEEAVISKRADKLIQNAKVRQAARNKAPDLFPAPKTTPVEEPSGAGAQRPGEGRLILSPEEASTEMRQRAQIENEARQRGMQNAAGQKPGKAPRFVLPSQQAPNPSPIITPEQFQGIQRQAAAPIPIRIPAPEELEPVSSAAAPPPLPKIAAPNQWQMPPGIRRASDTEIPFDELGG